MPTSRTSEDSGQYDARGRKLQRDRQNQRQKRRRERETLENLERRNASLERQVKALLDGSNETVRQLWNTVQSMSARTRATNDRLDQVNTFIKEWTAQDDTRSPRRDLYASTTTDETTGGIQPGPCVDVGCQGPLECEMNNSQYPAPSSNALNGADNSSRADIDGARVNVGPDRYERPSESLVSMTKSRQMPNVTHLTTYHELTIPITKLEEILTLPEWLRMPPTAPPTKTCFDPFGPIIQEMRKSIHLFKLCSPEPAALDLVLGGSLNELANAVHRATLHDPLRRTEKFAINWMSYLVARWFIHPSEDSYRRMPAMFRPTAIQLFVPHPPIFDYVVWPQLRDNFIVHGMKYCRAEVFGLLFCTCRVRNTRNTDYIVRSRGGDPQADPAFLEKIFSLDGWVLLEKFWNEYPELVVGMDREKIMILENDLV